MEPTKEPLETGAAPWQEQAAKAVSEWAGPMIFVHEGVDLAVAIEYGIADQINHRYVEDKRDKASAADPG